MNLLPHIFRIARPYNAILPLILVALGGISEGASTAVILMTVSAFFLLHSAVTIWNDIEDIHIDRDNYRDLSSFDKLGKNALKRIVIFLIAVGLGCGLLLSVNVFVVFICFVSLSYAYNSPPLQLSRRPIASIVILGACYALLPFWTGVLAAGQLSTYSVVLGVTLAISRMSLSILKDYKDAHGDAKHTKKTFLLVYGRTVTRRTSMLLACIGYAFTLATAWWFQPSLSTFYLIIGVFLCAWLVSQRQVLRKFSTYKALNEQFHKCIHYELLFYGYLAWLIT